MRGEPFIVLRRSGRNIEVHCVGCSGSALAELLGLASKLIEDGLLESNLGSEENEIEEIGHPDAPSGLRLTSFSDIEAIASILSAELDGIFVAEARS